MTSSCIQYAVQCKPQNKDEKFRIVFHTHIAGSERKRGKLIRVGGMRRGREVNILGIVIRAAK
jgi:hypothetical protein